MSQNAIRSLTFLVESCLQVSIADLQVGLVVGSLVVSILLRSLALAGVIYREIAESIIQDKVPLFLHG